MDNDQFILNCGLGLEYQCNQDWKLMESLQKKALKRREFGIYVKKCSKCERFVYLVNNLQDLKSGAKLNYCMLFDPYNKSSESINFRKRIGDVESKSLINLMQRPLLGVFKQK